MLDEQSVCTNDISYVGEVASGCEVSNWNNLSALELVQRDALGERRCHEAVRLTGAEMIERAHAHDLEPVAEVCLQGEVISCDLACRIRADWSERSILGEW